jgi:uncharacterized protein YdhG (YjbR/CyaY superfamily)
MKTNIKPGTIDEYIAKFPVNVQIKLREIRAIIKSAAPEADEKISYGMPTFYFHRNLVHFAAHTNHIGFYPGASGVVEFVKESNIYRSAKGSIQFPLDQPLPSVLITNVVKFRIKENYGFKKPKKKV